MFKVALRGLHQHPRTHVLYLASLTAPAKYGYSSAAGPSEAHAYFYPGKRLRTTTNEHASKDNVNYRVTAKRNHQTNRLLAASHSHPYPKVLQQIFSLQGIPRSNVLARWADCRRSCPLALGPRRHRVPS